jgi:surface antigen
MRIHIKKVMILSLISSLFMTSCSSKRDSGAIIGGVLGGTSGVIFGKTKKDRKKYGAMGTVLGAMIGASIGDYLDDQDKAELSRKAVELANNNQRNSAWKSDHSGATAALVVVDEYSENVEMIYSEPIVMEEPIYEPIVVENHSLGKRIDSTLKTKVATHSKPKRKTTVRSESKPKKRVATHSKPKKRTTIRSESKPRVVKYSKERKVLAQRKCKNVNITVRLPDGNRKTESVKTCQDKNGIYGV